MKFITTILTAFLILAPALARADQPLPAGHGTIQLGAGTYTVVGPMQISNVAYLGIPGKTFITGTNDRDGKGLYIRNDSGPDNVTLKNLSIKGINVFGDKADPNHFGLRLANVSITWCDFTDASVRFSMGMDNGTFTNNKSTGNIDGGHWFYIVGEYHNLNVSWNEMTDQRAGAHIDAKGASTKLTVQGNYCRGMGGIGIELQGSVDGAEILDNFWELPTVALVKDCAAFSFILDKSTNVHIARNVSRGMTSGAQPVRVPVYAMEVGGGIDAARPTLIEQNLIDGTYDSLIDNDHEGPHYTKAIHNRISNVGKNPPWTVSESIDNGINAMLNWDVNRGHPTRSGTFTGSPVQPPSTGPTTEPCDEAETLKAALAKSQADLKAANATIQHQQKTKDQFDEAWSQ